MRFGRINRSSTLLLVVCISICLVIMFAPNIDVLPARRGFLRYYRKPRVADGSDNYHGTSSSMRSAEEGTLVVKEGTLIANEASIVNVVEIPPSVRDVSDKPTMKPLLRMLPTELVVASSSKSMSSDMESAHEDADPTPNATESVVADAGSNVNKSEAGVISKDEMSNFRDNQALSETNTDNSTETTAETSTEDYT